MASGGWWRRRTAAAQQRRAELSERADQQHRWAARGDSRGVYGPEGAALMRTVAPGPRPADLSPPGPDLPVAGVVHTDAQLTRLLADRLPNWRYAAFVSVLVQRRATVAARLRDVRMGFAEVAEPALATTAEVASFFTERLTELSELVEQIDTVMLSTAFQQALGDSLDGDSADPAAVVHAAGRLMDCHHRLLSLAEHCRAVRLPHACRDLQRDFCLLTILPLDAFDRFIDEFGDRIVEMADVARYATGDVRLDPVELTVSDDGGLIEKVSVRLRRMAAADR